VAGGRGSVRLKRAPDYWELRAYAGRDPATGRDSYVSRGFKGTKREAQRELTRLLAAADQDGPTATRTVSEVLTAHLAHLETRGREAKTLEAYRSIVNQVAEDAIGKMTIRKVGVKTLDDYYVRLRKRGLAPATIVRYHALLRAAFRQAMAWGWITRNPVQLATPPSVPRVGRRIPTPEVVGAILMAAGDSRNPENGVAFRLLAATGARRGEVCGLRWRDVDPERRTLNIRTAIATVVGQGLIEKEPKSHQQRVVTIDARTAELLAAHRAEQAALMKELGGEPGPEAFVLADVPTDPTGHTPIDPDRLTQAFARIRSRVPGAASLRLHDLRHWYASTQLDAGEPLPAVAARIGDHVETLAKVYAHKGHRGDAEAAAAIGSLLDG
jgi:integrase